MDSGLRKAKLRNPRLQTDALVLQASSAARLLEKWKKELLRLLASTEKARGKRSLRLQEVSKDSATQRAGRAGREGPGRRSLYSAVSSSAFGVSEIQTLLRIPTRRPGVPTLHGGVLLANAEPQDAGNPRLRPVTAVSTAEGRLR